MNTCRCSQYWPLDENKAMTVGGQKEYTIVKTAAQKKYLCDKKSMLLSTLELTADGLIAAPAAGITCRCAPRTVRHLHWSDWPDRSVPRDARTVIKIRKHMMAAAEGDRPILIHCSAGIGRVDEG